VLTTGSLHLAYNFGGSTTEVNGVRFTGWANPASGTTTATNTRLTITTNGTATFATDANSISSSNVTSGTFVNTPYRDLFTAQFAVNPGSTTASVPNTIMNYTISGLQPTYQYVLQFWANYSNAPGTQSNPAGRTVTVADNLAFSGSTVLDVNSTDAAGGVGQFVTGTFTANASTQTFYTLGSINSTPSSQARNYGSALQVRLLAVPEPSTLALASLGIVSVGTWFGRRRMRRAAEESSAADAGATA
jgi:hypothetical protein